MDPHRVNTADLQAALTQAEAHARQIVALLQPFAVLLSDKERASTPRARANLPEAAKALARALEDHPDLAQIARFDAATVLEDVDNAQALQPLRLQLGIIEQMVADSHLAWMGAALGPCLTAYRLAKAASKTQPGLKPVIDPIYEIFSTRRDRKP